uniref:Protein quiver n=1 Tax=Onchocerca volvulus TaxID=6282 RepID=A0A2K6VP90_ONCVO
MFTVTLLFFYTLYTTIPQGYSLVCYLCDSIGESNCFGGTCIGTACIKRSALIHGFLRVQKMCQQTSEPLLEYCETNVRWKGGTGTECICQTDYCNNTGKVFQNIFLIFFPFIITSFISKISSVRF